MSSRFNSGGVVGAEGGKTLREDGEQEDDQEGRRHAQRANSHGLEARFGGIAGLQPGLGGVGLMDVDGRFRERDVTHIVHGIS
jgi:hypothetical protein